MATLQGDTVSWYTSLMLSEVSYEQIVWVLVSLLLGLGFHEAMHAFTAYRLGDQTAALQGRLTLNPLRHIDIMTTILLPLVMMLLHLPPILVARPVPFDPMQVKYREYGAALVALAGPFTNLGLAILGSVLMHLFASNTPQLAEGIAIFILVNVSLFVFNMLPLPPLDGSRLLYAFAPEPLQNAMAQFEGMGFFVTITILFLLLPVLSPILYVLNQAILGFLL